MARLYVFVIAAYAWANDVPVPSACTPQVNQKLAGLLQNPPRGSVDNVMVCGVTVSSSRTQHGGAHGDHQIIPVLAPMPDGSSKLIEVVTNDELDGRITAPAKASVLAYGQAFFTRTGRFAAGVHETHCATHRGADNVWVVVNGKKFPASCPQ